MNISSGTVVLASAVLTLTAAAFGQQQQTASSQTGMNFYVTTPQTGETVPVGATPATSQQQNVVVASAQAARSLNTYTDRAVSSRLNAAPVQSASQTSTRAPQAQPATPVSQVQATSARHPQSQAAPVAAPGRQTQLASAPNPASAHGYSIQQVSNAPASSFQAARSSAASSRAIHAQNARTAQRQVSTSAAQHPSFYSNSHARQAARNHTSGAQAAHAGSTAQKQSLLNRLTGRNRQQATAQHRPEKAAAAQHDTVPAIKPSKLNGTRQTGIASWYGGKWHGRKTANGERYDQNSLTAAHKTLPFGTLVKVRNERNGREVIVRINNRGPFTRGRIIDLSKSAASKLGMVSAGITKVTCEVVGRS